MPAEPRQVDFLPQPPAQPVFDDDETTEPSSAANTAENNADTQPSSLSRFLESARRRLSKSYDQDDDLVDGAIICGYLHKLGRNGKWQSRWFETDGECLSYYKSSKRVKLLATLDLEKVRVCMWCMALCFSDRLSDPCVIYSSTGGWH